MVLVSLPKKPCFYRILQRVNGSDTKGLVETRGVESIKICRTSYLPLNPLVLLVLY